MVNGHCGIIFYTTDRKATLFEGIVLNGTLTTVLDRATNKTIGKKLKGRSISGYMGWIQGQNAETQYRRGTNILFNITLAALPEQEPVLTDGFPPFVIEEEDDLFVNGTA